MSNVYLTELTNQKKKLATTLNNKGIIASESEKFNTLVPKVKNIVELKGEEKTLDAILTYNDVPESVVQLEYPKSKNLFDNSLLSDWGLTLTNNKYVGSVGTLANKNIGTNFKENTQYTLSIKGFTHTDSVTSLLVDISYTDGTTITGIRFNSTEEKTYTYTSSAGKTVNYIQCTFYNSDTITISYIQLEKGTVATPYEPVPHTNIDLQLSSKNLLNADNISNLQFTNVVSKGNGACIIKTLPDITNTPITNLYSSYLPAGKYYLSGKLKIENTLGTARDNEILLFVNNTFQNNWVLAHSGDGEYNISTYVTLTEYSKLRISFYPTVSNTTTTTAEYQATFTNLQLELSSTATPYTPYISDLTAVNVTACGKNLIPYPYSATTKTVNGVTFTDNGDGSITVNGTATANAVYELQTNNSMLLLPQDTYTLSGCPAGGSASTYFMVAVNGIGVSYTKFIRDFGNGAAFSSDNEKWKISIRIMSGTTVNNLVFKPQFELGSTATPYEPYQGQTYTPTSDGKVTGISSIYPITNIFTDNAGALITVKGGAYKEILPSTGNNGITKIWQEVVGSDIDENIKPENIKKGITILSVTGTME